MFKVLTYSQVYIVIEKKDKFMLILIAQTVNDKVD
jgi:hypothetical protein